MEWAILSAILILNVMITSFVGRYGPYWPYYLVRDYKMPKRMIIFCLLFGFVWLVGTVLVLVAVSLSDTKGESGEKS